MATDTTSYPASLQIVYPQKFDRLTTFFRLILVVPILIILMMISAASGQSMTDGAGTHVIKFSGGIELGLFVATALMILFRQIYPRWWFDFALELNRFSARVGAYLFLLTDQYPSTTEAQSVHMDITYPDAKHDLNRWLVLVKWLLALPHYIVLGILMVAALVTTVIAWFAIMFTGRYPKGLFDFVVGVGRWTLRVNAYSSLLTTDQYPPFSLK